MGSASLGLALLPMTKRLSAISGLQAASRWLTGLALCATALTTSERAASADEGDEAQVTEPEPAPVGPPAPRVARAAPPSALAPAVSVALDAARGSVLEMRDAATGGFRPVCYAPCRSSLPSDGVYRIAGDGISPSYEFGLRSSGGRPVVLHVEEADPVALVAGVVLGSLSMPLGYGGLMLATDRLTCRTCSGRPVSGPSEGEEGRKIAGGVMLGAAAVVALVGTYLVVTNRRTTVEQVVERSPVAAPRAPEFRGASATDLPSATLMPILGAHF